MPRTCPEPETSQVASDSSEDRTLEQLESALEDLSAALRSLTDLLVVKATALAFASSTRVPPPSPHASVATHDPVRRRGRIPVIARRQRMRRRSSGS